MIEPILLSWISEWVYCPRRFYLRIMEENRLENQFIVEGALDHQHVHKGKIEKRGNLIKVSGLPVYSNTKNLYGICDSVEFEISDQGIYIPFLDKKCIICPVEYKHGKRRNLEAYNLQMVAQAVCLEEMFAANIERGFLYYAGSKERVSIELNQDIRNRLDITIDEISEYLKMPNYIAPVIKKRCNGCSVKEICEPRKTTVSKYMSKIRDKYI